VRLAMLRHLTITVAVLLAAAPLAACGKSESSSSSKSDAPPEKPSTGAPATFIVDKFDATSLDVRVYNFSDKKIAGWGVLMRYYDDKGNVLKVKTGTPFEKDFDFWSMSGRRYIVEPASWASIKIDDIEVPKGTAKAEVLASRMSAVNADGTAVGEPVFSMSMMEWPKPKG
jgi:hypothetical protein